MKNYPSFKEVRPILISDSIPSYRFGGVFGLSFFDMETYKFTEPEPVKSLNSKNAASFFSNGRNRNKIVLITSFIPKREIMGLLKVNQVFSVYVKEYIKTYYQNYILRKLKKIYVNHLVVQNHKPELLYIAITKKTTNKAELLIYKEMIGKYIYENFLKQSKCKFKYNSTLNSLEKFEFVSFMLKNATNVTRLDLTVDFDKANTEFLEFFDFFIGRITQLSLSVVNHSIEMMDAFLTLLEKATMINELEINLNENNEISRMFLSYLPKLQPLSSVTIIGHSEFLPDLAKKLEEANQLKSIKLDIKQSTKKALRKPEQSKTNAEAVMKTGDEDINNINISSDNLYLSDLLVSLIRFKNLESLTLVSETFDFFNDIISALKDNFTIREISFEGLDDLYLFSKDFSIAGFYTLKNFTFRRDLEDYIIEREIAK